MTWTGDAHLDGLYEQSYFQDGEYADYQGGLGAQRLNFRRKIWRVRKHASFDWTSARVLELGCATGAFLDEARRAGASDVLGVEVSAWARTQCVAAGIPVLGPEDPTLGEAVSSLRPNVLVSWDTWEHLAQPATTIGDLVGRLNAGAVIALSTVDSGSLVARLRKRRWRQFHPPTHLNYPTRASLRLAMTRCGCRTLHQGRFGYYRPLLEYARTLGVTEIPGVSKTVMATPIFLDLGDTQLQIARKHHDV